MGFRQPGSSFEDARSLGCEMGFGRLWVLGYRVSIYSLVYIDRDRDSKFGACNIINEKN